MNTLPALSTAGPPLPPTPIFCCPGMIVVRCAPELQVNTWPCGRDVSAFLRFADTNVTWRSLYNQPSANPFGIVVQRNPFGPCHVEVSSIRRAEHENPGPPRRFVSGTPGVKIGSFEEVTVVQWEKLNVQCKGEIGVFECLGECGRVTRWGIWLFEINEHPRAGEPRPYLPVPEPLPAKPQYEESNDDSSTDDTIDPDELVMIRPTVVRAPSIPVPRRH